MPDSFRFIVDRLIHEPAVIPGITAQFNPPNEDGTNLPRSVNAAFLLALGNGPLSCQALEYLLAHRDDPCWSNTARFYLEVLDRIESEISDRMVNDPGFNKAIQDLVKRLRTGFDPDHPEIVEGIRNVFFPEGAGLPGDRAQAVGQLRKQRTVVIRALNPDPVKFPHREILFTSNVLLTVPPSGKETDSLLNREMTEIVKGILSEEQAFWYDHPIPIGIETAKNEAVYGLKELEDAVCFEIRRGTAPPDARIPVLLSLSTTHHGLRSLARPWIREELEKSGSVPHLDLFAVSEDDVRDLLDEVLFPASTFYSPGAETDALKEVLGVDGEYGRHYSFLKAVAALWHVLLDTGVRATFKIDLDQVFPQEVLVSETGRSAFEHLSDPLWGAEGRDAEGREVRLGMLAGALVNQWEIKKGLFTPDVKWPPGKPEGDRWIFDSTLPQALSTEGEMMARYGEEGPDGRRTCLQRVHVTGGTTGILIKDLRRYRPFTPAWIGRAEDQAYLMSVLETEKGPALRYVHASGFFMRHDKESFAGDTIEAARLGKEVGDYVRILAFSSYARGLPWGADRIKEAVDPFTGCFISKIPVTVSALRLALSAACLFGEGSEGAAKEAEDLLSIGCARLTRAVRIVGNTDLAGETYRHNKSGWDLFYDTLDGLEKGLSSGNPFAERIRQKARMLVDGWRI